MTGLVESKPVVPLKKERIHPLVIRLTHWMNFAALIIMVGSGMQIYNASPIFAFEFPSWITLGGWLQGGRQWHFFAMWLFALNGAIWVGYNVFSRHGRYTTLFRPQDIHGVLPMIKYYLRLIRHHPPSGKYNALQKLTYTSLPLLGLMILLSGMSIYWPVQFQWITSVFGNYDTARIWHFLAMAAIVIFFLGHLVMVAIAGWDNLLSMFTGRGAAHHGEHDTTPSQHERANASPH